MNKLFVFLLLFNIALRAYSSDNEIEQAKEAAPSHITEHASYMVWDKNRFVRKLKGTNEFVCMVVKDGKGRYEPSCFNRAAMKAVFPVYEYQAKLLAQGKTIQEIHDKIKKKSMSKYFPAPEPGAIVYMMSKNNKYYDYFNNKLMDIPPHIMLYFPKIKASSLEFSGEKGLPMFYDEYPHLSVVHIHTH